MIALAAAAFSESSESHVRSCLATRNRVGPNAADRTRRRGRRIPVASEWRERRHEAPPAGGAPRRGQRGAAADMHCRPDTAGPSITEGGWVGSKSLNIMARVEGTYGDSDNSRFSRFYNRGSSDLYTP